MNCECVNFKQSGRGKIDKKHQTFYANLASLAYKTAGSRKKQAPIGYILDEELSNDDVAVFHNPTTNKTVSSITGSRFDSKKHRMRDLRSDIGTMAGTDRLGKRTKEMTAVVKKAMQKYGGEQTCTGHSLGGRMCRNVSKKLGIPGVLFNQGASPISAITDKIAKTFRRDNKNSKTISYTTGNDIVSKSAQVLRTDDASHTVKMPKGKKKGIVANHDIENFTDFSKQYGGAKMSPWIAHVKAYQMKNGVSYKEAMSLSRASYRK